MLVSKVSVRVLLLCMSILRTDGLTQIRPRRIRPGRGRYIPKPRKRGQLMGSRLITLSTLTNVARLAHRWPMLELELGRFVLWPWTGSSCKSSSSRFCLQRAPRAPRAPSSWDLRDPLVGFHVGCWVAPGTDHHASAPAASTAIPSSPHQPRFASFPSFLSRVRLSQTRIPFVFPFPFPFVDRLSLLSIACNQSPSHHKDARTLRSDLRHASSIIAHAASCRAPPASWAILPLPNNHAARPRSSPSLVWATMPPPPTTS